MILDRINKANDIKNIAPEDYPELASEIRDCIISTVSSNGGHLSSSLGVVELTMALHLALNLPDDKILWDVGHQSYAHKILTGRRKSFDTLRKLGGISGFPNPFESDCDSFMMGHASTSLSAALGFVKARELSGGSNSIVSVIGDGAFTGGMIFEALNNAASLKSNLIIILNDNEMSISKNVGGVSKVLTNLRTDKKYNELKYSVKKNLSKIPGCGDDIIGRIHKTKSSIKQFFVPGMMFEDMGITYLGPVNGHDVGKMVRMINMAKRLDHAVIIHVHTQKGKGYEFAEKRPSFYHGVAPFDRETGELKDKRKIRDYSDVFSTHITKMAETDKKIVGITAAMCDGTGLKKFSRKYPERFFDVGIAEEHAVTFAAGLASAGFKPYVAIYSTFLQRGFDQILHDVCIQKLPVRFIVERAGIAGCDGITHQGIFDLSYLNIIPGMTIMAPKNRFELRDMLYFTQDYDGPVAIRFPKGNALDIYSDNNEPIVKGKSEVLCRGKDIAILGIGTGVDIAGQVEDILLDKGYTPTVVNARFVKPIDEELIDSLASSHRLIVTIEENVIAGAYGMNVLDYVNRSNITADVLNCGLPDEFIDHGTISELRHETKFCAEDIAEDIIRRFN